MEKKDFSDFLSVQGSILHLAAKLYSDRPLETNLIAMRYWADTVERQSHYFLALRTLAKNSRGIMSNGHRYEIYLERNDNRSGGEGFNDTVAVCDKDSRDVQCWVNPDIWQHHFARTMFYDLLHLLEFIEHPCCDYKFNNMTFYFECQFPDKATIRFCPKCGKQIPIIRE